MWEIFGGDGDYLRRGSMKGGCFLDVFEGDIVVVFGW